MATQVTETKILKNHPNLLENALIEYINAEAENHYDGDIPVIELMRDMIREDTEVSVYQTLVSLAGEAGFDIEE